ncbi:MAG: beta-N-acetylhexosaminidase [Phycisphaerae bacterium]|nr:beta-N-acetylhexosaminidase [Phycisphaerae bacterium]
MAANLSWNPLDTPEPVARALGLLAEEYPIREGGPDGVAVSFRPPERSSGFTIERAGGGVTVSYARTCDALRAVGTLLAELAGPEETYAESTDFTTLGIMLDCSRNAVMTAEHFRKWLRRLALMGYNMAMLYTEDTYELPDEPYFGYLRGRYTADELREIDAYAAGLGIEMIGCIQTLGHLGQLRWSAFNEVKDTADILLVDEPRTYELIEKMIAQFAAVYTSRRVHIGMDEAHSLGRGKFMDRFGYERGYDIFNRHLGRVVEICRKHGLSPMIWSDMYFRMGSKTGQYYDTACVIPPDVKAAIPEGVQLVYWDYYHEDEEFYLDFIARHRDLGSEPVVGSGVWTWGMPWYGRKITESAAGACVRACRDSGVKELFFTLWGDDGGYCEFDSALAGLQYAAELAWTGQADPKVLEKRFAATCFGSYAANTLAGELGVPKETASYLWDDPLLGIFHRNTLIEDPRRWDHQAEAFGQLAQKLAAFKDDRGAGNLSHALLLAQLLAVKLAVRSELHRAYAKDDTATLKSLRRDIEKLIGMIEAFDKSFCDQWLRRNKVFGLEAMQLRFAGLVRRHRELDRRIEDYLSGRAGSIPELDTPLPETATALKPGCRWLSSGSIIT